MSENEQNASSFSNSDINVSDNENQSNQQEEFDNVLDEYDDINWYDEVDDEFYDNDWYSEDLDENSDDEPFLINAEVDSDGEFHFHARMESEEEEEMEIPPTSNQVSPFDYLTHLIQREETDSFYNYSNTPQITLPETGIHKACIIPLREIIPLPGEQIPYVTSNPSIVILLLQILGIHASSEESRLVPCLIGYHIEDDYDEVEIKYGCTITIQKAYFNEHTFSIGVICTCIRKCEVKSYSLSHTHVITGEIELLEESNPSLLTLPTLPSVSSPLQLFPLINRRVCLPAWMDHTEEIIQQYSLYILCNTTNLYVNQTDTEILRQLPSDTIELSYLLCNQLLLNYHEEKQLFLCPSPEERIVLAKELCYTSPVIRCKCHKKLSRFMTYQRLNLFGGNTSKSVFVNRFGNSFRVLTIRSLMDYIAISEPSSEDTWFPGYQWQIIVCPQCGNHIGWKFTAESETSLDTFFALSQSSIVFSKKLSVCLENRIKMR